MILHKNLTTHLQVQQRIPSCPHEGVHSLDEKGALAPKRRELNFSKKVYKNCLMLEILVIAVCLLLNSILACAEIAFVSVKKNALYSLSQKGNKKAKLLLSLREKPEKILSVIQVGITFVGMLAAATGGAGSAEFIIPWLIKTFHITHVFATILSILIVVVPLTYLNVVLGELVPKMLALKQSTFFALATVKWLHWISILLYPLIKILEWSTKAIVTLAMKLFKPKTVEEEKHESIELQALSPPGRRYVLNIVNLEKKQLKDILLPWKQVTCVRKENSIKEVEEIAVSSGHTRLPVIENDRVIGVLHTKEFFAYNKEDKSPDWNQMIREPLRFQEDQHLLSTLLKMQEKNTHMGFVYQKETLLGIITIEEILEEIVGDIYDEDDENAALHFRTPHSF